MMEESNKKNELKLILKFPAKSKSNAAAKALTLLQEYPLKTEGVWNECEVDYWDLKVQEVLNLLARVKGTTIVYGDRTLDLRQIQNIISCSSRRGDCHGGCFILQMIHPLIMDCFEKIEGDTGQLYEYQLHFFEDFLTKVSATEYQLDKERLKQNLMEEKAVYFPFCAKADLQKTLNLLEKLPSHFKIIPSTAFIRPTVVQEENTELKQNLRECLSQARDSFTAGDFSAVIQQANSFKNLLEEYDGSKFTYSQGDIRILDMKPFINAIGYHLQSPIESIAASERVREVFRAFNVLDVMRRSFVYGIEPQDTSLFFYDFFDSATIKAQALAVLEEEGFEFLPPHQCPGMDSQYWLKKILGITEPTLQKFVDQGITSLEAFKQLDEAQLKALNSSKKTRTTWMQRARVPINLWRDVIREERYLADFYHAKKVNNDVIWQIIYSNNYPPCPECRKLEGTRLPSSSIPKRPHFDCRCKIVSETEYTAQEPLRQAFLIVEAALTIAQQKDGRCLSTGYFEPQLTWECKAGHTWKAPASSIKEGTWCPKCAK